MAKTRLLSTAITLTVLVLCASAYANPTKAREYWVQSSNERFDSLGAAKSALQAANPNNPGLVRMRSETQAFKTIHYFASQPVKADGYSPYEYRLCLAEGGGAEPCGTNEDDYSSQGAAEGAIANRYGNDCESDPAYTKTTGDVYYVGTPSTGQPASNDGVGGVLWIEMNYLPQAGCPTERTIKLSRTRTGECATPYIQDVASNTNEVVCYVPGVFEIHEYNVYYDHDDQECYGNPCDPSTGNKIERFSDYEAPGIDFYRTYRSLIPDDVANGGCGYTQCASMPAGWTHSYGMRLIFDAIPPQFQYIPCYGYQWTDRCVGYNPIGVGTRLIGLLRPDGSLLPIDQNNFAADGSGTRIALQSVPVEPARDVTAATVTNYTVFLADGSREEYVPVGIDGDDCAHPIAYRLARVVDAGGLTTTVNYEFPYCGVRPTSVSNQFGHSVSLTYTEIDSGAKILTGIDAPNVSTNLVLTNDEERYERFETLSGDILLTYSTDPSEFPGLLKSVTDQDSKKSIFNYDLLGRATGTRTGETDSYNVWLFDYNDAANSVTITDGNGVERIMQRWGNAGPWHLVSSVTLNGQVRRSSYSTSDPEYRADDRTDERGVKTDYDYGASLSGDRLNKMTVGDGDDKRVYEYQYLNTTSALRTEEKEPSVCDGPIEDPDNPGSLITTDIFKTTVTNYVPGTQHVESIVESGYAESADGSKCEPITRTTSFSNHTAWGAPGNIDGPRTDTAMDTWALTYHACMDPAQGNECGQIHTITNGENHIWTFAAYNGNGVNAARICPCFAVLRCPPIVGNVVFR